MPLYPRLLSRSIFPFLFLLSINPALAQAKEQEYNSETALILKKDSGAYYWQKGDFTRAISNWREEAKIYQEEGLIEKEAETVLRLAQGYTNLGQFRLAIAEIERIIPLVKNDSTIARAWKKLGNAHSRSGEFTEAENAYQNSLDIEQNLSTLNNLVRLHKKQNNLAKLQAESAKKGKATERYLNKAELYQASSLKYAEEALALSQINQSSSAVRALIEWGEISRQGLSQSQFQRGRELLANLSPSRNKVFLIINWAKLDREQAKNWLNQAIKTSTTINDAVAESYALLELGYLFEKDNNWSEALQYGYLAQLKAQSKFLTDSLYKAQWLIGRIYKQLGNDENAILNYRNAIASLDYLNKGLTTISIEKRIDFQSEIEPIYRGMLELLLHNNTYSQANLREAILVFDKLQLAKLQNFFGDNCLELISNTIPIRETLAENNNILVNTILLEDRTHIILEYPDGTLHHSWAEIQKKAIVELANNWYETLKQTNNRRLLTLSRQFYDYLIRPFEKEIEEINPSTIIFVNDGVLRNLPMAALYDGEEFLAEKWASYATIGLHSTITNSNKKSELVAFGLGLPREGWSELFEVKNEIKNIVEIFGGKSFINEKFTSNNFTQELREKQHSHIHIASHGYFGGIAENSFILAYDKPISALDLANYLSQSRTEIDLLVLSACETAISSDRSVLGLAGMALRSNVASVIGSYWNVLDDEQAELIEQFYSYIKKYNLSPAKAIQKIQIEQIEILESPSRWASLNLIKN